MPLNLEEKLGVKKDYINLEEKNELNKIDNIIVILGAPIVNAEKAAKLRIFFLRLLKDMGPIVKNEIFIPLNPESGESSGVLFIEFVNNASVQNTITKFNNYKMDKAHTLKVFSYSEIDEAMNTNDESVSELKESSYEPLVNCEKRPDTLWNWLNDDVGGEQFSVRYDDETQIYKTSISKPLLVYGGEREKSEGKHWCDSTIEWSPQGTYLVTFHAQGVVLWGGDNMEKLLRYQHVNVKKILFSPKERFLITWNGTVGIDNTDAICIWDVLSGKLLRMMPCLDKEWPSYQFSYDEKYFATKGKDSLAVYEFVPNAPTYFVQLDRKLIPAVGIKQFNWSPLRNQIVYWSEETKNKPASIYILEIPSKQIIQSSSIANVIDIKFCWQNKGKYLAAYVQRNNKTKKRIIHQFNIFRMMDRFIPVETLIVENEKVVDYSFEGNGSKFAIAHTNAPNKSNIAMYDLEANTKHKEVTLLYTLTDKLCNHMYWCPTGKILIIAGLGSPFSGTIEWYNSDTKEVIASNEHFVCNGISWDYSGRFVSSFVVNDEQNLKYSLENGYKLWNYIGEPIAKVDHNKFRSFQWRPYPEIDLTDEEMADLTSNLKKYTNKYKVLAKRTEQLAHISETRKKLALIDAFRSRREGLKSVLERIHKEREALGIQEDNDDNYVYSTQVFETVLETKQEIIP